MSAYPEDVVVFEVADSVQSFVSAVRNAEGLSWLAEAWDPDTAPEAWTRREKPVDRRLYFIGATERGIAELLGLWGLYCRDPSSVPRGHRAWVPLFNQLVDVRRFGREDRLTPETLEELDRSVLEGARQVVIEVELWFRRRANGARGVSRAVEALGGRVLVDATPYPAAGTLLMLVELPSGAVRQLREDPQVALAELMQVRALRAGPQATTDVAGEAVDGRPPRAEPCLDKEPVVAVFDGVPLQNHEALQGAILVEDPQNLAVETPVGHRHHGTAVVSVALWRDIDSPAPQPSRPIYVRPIMHHDGGLERCPADQILAEVLREAVERMPRSVAVVNLSIGVWNREYDGREPSALARVLDALAWQYKVLFIVAAGNYDPRHDALQVSARAGDDATVRHRALLQAVRQSSDMRRLLSPAESINALTVGALDEDDIGNTRPGWSPAWNTRGPAIYSRQGRGHRRANKPELVVPGGQQPLQLHARDGSSCRVVPFVYERPVRNLGGVGVAVAAPGGPASPTRGKRFVRGTSFAAPRVTHAAAHLSDALDALVASTGINLFGDAPRALWLKCLLVHCASRRELEPWAGL
ncbi:MAG: S8 family peptidase, partial [Alphaproteobacteria bacterium]|nr:S8 family peptidase [Alphaproteobacteria bacterium]